MVISDMSADWLKTPGIATRSIKEIESVPKESRWRKFVVLGFRGTDSDQKIMENHERHMNNLKERYMRMKGMEEEVKEEEKKEVKEANSHFPSFGTRSTYCDKSGRRLIGSPQSTAVPALTSNAKECEQQLKFDRPSSPNSPKEDHRNQFNGVVNKQQNVPRNQRYSNKPTTFKGFTPYEAQPIYRPIYVAKFEGFANIKMQQQPNNYSTPLYIETDPSKLIQRSDNLPFDALIRPQMTRQSSFDCPTPTESRLCTPEASPSPHCPTDDSFPVFKCDKEIITEKRISFEIVNETNTKTISGCVNPTVKEKIRRYNKEPTAAGKRYLKPLDIVNNSAAHQLHTQIKFDKNRVKRWVGRFQSFHPSNDPTSNRPRRYSNTDEGPVVVPNCPINYEEEEEETHEDVGLAGEIFDRMCRWIGDVKWKVEDNGRISFPKEGSTIIVRVLSSRGRRAVVVPADIFDRILEESKQFIIFNSPPRIPSDFFRYALVLLEQDSHEIGQKEYRRGWIFDGNERELRVLLIDERRIVSSHRSRLFLCPDPGVMDIPPLCVAATFHRELMDHEKELLLEMGCSAKCRVMKEGEKALKASLGLHLSRINAEGHSLDIMFCGEECAGACYHHMKN